MNNRTRYLLLLLLAVLDTHVKAQWNFDIPVVEAYINDHKQQRSLLLARSTLELSNQLLHEYSSDAAVGYKELNIDFDKYTRAFDVIDVLYQSLRTSLNVYSTYNTVSDRIGDYKNLLGDYGKSLYRSVTDLVLYATGAAACSTSDLLLILEGIHIGLDNIEAHLNKAYFETWRYIQLRIGYWKESVYRQRGKAEIIEGAFGRWREAGRLW